METVRTTLDRRFRRTMLSIYGGVTVFLAATLLPHTLGIRANAAAWLGLVAFAFAWLGMVFAWLGLRCPACGSRLAGLLWYSSLRPRLGVDPRIVCCPYCRQDFDRPVAPRGGTFAGEGSA